MTAMRAAALVVCVVALAGGPTLAQTAGAPVAAANETPGPSDEAEDKAWSFSASASTYFLPDSRDFVQPTVVAGRGRLHLEARFNYEGLDTGSVWVGYSVSLGERLTLDLTPMVGVVFGHTTGVAPGYKGSLGWRRLELYAETEYVFDAVASEDSFLYTWSELTFTPADWCRIGLVVQRTKAYETEFDIQRGFLAGFSYKRVNVSGYLFNPDASRPTVVFTVGIGS
jgi:hypothetical protein